MINKLKEFARERIAGHAGLWHPQDFPLDLWRAMAAEGLLGFGLGEGAAGIANIAQGSAVIAEATGSLGFASAWAGQAMVPLMLSQKAGLPDELLRKAKAGEAVIALAISEPKAGAHPKHIATTATKVNGGYRMDGEKAYLTNGPIATHVAVLAITDVVDGRKQFSFFLVPMGTPGMALVNHPQFDFLRPAQHCGLKIENCVVPESALIGRPGHAFEDVAMPFRNLEDAAGIGSLVAGLRHIRAELGVKLGPVEDEAAITLGEIAGIEAALQLLAGAILQALGRWQTESEVTGAQLVAVRDLARREAGLLRGLGADRDPHAARILRDIEKSLDIARMARQIRKAKLGRSLLSLPGTPS